MGSGSSKKRSTPTILQGYRREPTQAVVTEDKSRKQDQPTAEAQKGGEVQASEEKPREVQAPEVQASQETEDDKEFVKVVYGSCNSKWPIRCYGKLDVNVNAHHGGGAALYFVSCAYGGKGEETTAQLLLTRSGFDCNHIELKSIIKDHEGHFGPSNGLVTDEDGNLVADCLFGHNHMMFLSNESRHGNLRNGVLNYLPTSPNSTSVELPLNVNGTRDGQSGAGLTLLLCSSLDSGTLVSAAYMIRSGFKSNKYCAKVICGEDKYKFAVHSNGMLSVTGPGDENKYALYHNRDNLMSRPGYTCVAQTQSVDGKEREVLLDNLTRHASFMVLCSSSNGMEDSTVAALYFLAVCDGNLAVSKLVSGCHGKSYTSADLWTFTAGSGQLIVQGPDGPCRYGVLSNMKAEKSELASLIKQSVCLGTGEPVKTTGNVKVTLSGVRGEVSKKTDICIMFNHKKLTPIPESTLKPMGSLFTFDYDWGQEEKADGYHLVRVFAVRKHALTGKEVQIELSGSPYALTRQPPGVQYALNCAGPAYQAVNDVVYSSEFHQFASFTYDMCFGSQCTATGKQFHVVDLPAMMLNSHDGFLHMSVRSPGVEADDEHQIDYRVKDVPNGKHTFRLHMTSKPSKLSVCGNDVTSQLNKNMKKNKARNLTGPTSYVSDIDVNINNNELRVYSRNDMVSGFALLSKDYKEKTRSDADRQQDEMEKARLADQIAQLAINVTKKKMTIVGWSPNLLLNASGQLGNMSHWNTAGAIKVTEGGHGTDKCFITSHMWSEKNQEINLLDHFSAEYLDTAPAIQVSEFYSQGVCGGGFYQFTAELLSKGHKVIANYGSGQIGSVYKDGWHEVTHTFTNYGPGVRTVAFCSKGKDDKFWAGDYGCKMSAAQVRVKRETKAADGDAFEDLKVESLSESNTVDELVTNLLIENQELLQQNAMEDQTSADQTVESQSKAFKRGTITKPRSNKKREIRVFVSSTFRDFTQEREEIIKKAFREVNRLCAERGVFFTYVDLRWGITSEQTDDGKTISICLQEIDRCRPYFICLMGERFGWCQREDKPDETLNMTYDYALENIPNLAWIDKYRFDSSVTELEIFHGVLNNIDAAKDKSFFYLRDPPNKEELSEDDFKRRTSESDWHQERVNWLKSQVTSRPELTIARFKTADQVAHMIKEDLEKSINEDFPLGTALTKLEQQRAAHHAFASVRCRVYIGREEYFTEINRHRKEQITQPFVLLGESGSGKSALVANWCKRVEDAEPDTFMFVHFIGSSSDSADYMKLLRRLFEEMKSFFNLDLQIPSSDTLLIRELPKWLRIAGSRSKVIVVMDALNQLDDGSGKDGAEHDLMWIPGELPPNVFMLLSTLPGRTLMAVEKFGWPSMPVSPLQEGDKLQIITDYLQGIYGKTLNKEQVNMLVNAPQTSNPLFLKSLLDEVRMYGSFRTLTAKIEEYLKAQMPSELFAKILERLEADFEEGSNSRERLVHDATTALWCANKGMAEAELVALLQVPSAVWSPFYLSLFENLVNRDGLLNFFHDHLRQAVENKYLATDDAKKQGYLTLANFFSEQETSDRTVEELPFLLTKAGELERLKAYVSDVEVFRRLNQSEDGYFELVKAWKTLGGFSLAEEAYMDQVQSLSEETIMADHEYYLNLYSKLGDFFRNLGLRESAKMIYIELVKQLEVKYGESHGTIVYHPRNQTRMYRCKHPDIIKNLQNLGQVYMQLGELDKAVSVYKDAINRQNHIETPAQQLQLSEGLLGLATTYVQKREMVLAIKLTTRALELATDLLGHKHHFVASIYLLIGQLSYEQGRLQEALEFYLVDLRSTRSEFGTSHPSVATVLNELALVYDDQNNVKAGKLYEAALSIILETYGNNYLGTGVIRYNLGTFYFGTNYFAKASYQFQQAYQIHANFLGEDHADTKAVKEALDNVKAMA